MRKLISLDIHGKFESGFSITAGSFKDSTPSEFINGEKGNLPANLNIRDEYRSWQFFYQTLTASFPSFPLNRHPVMANISAKDNNYQLFKTATEQLINNFNKWLKCEEFSDIESFIRNELDLNEENRILILSDDPWLRKLPWHDWNIIKDFSQTEVGFASQTFRKPEQVSPIHSQVKILVILGHQADMESQGQAIAKLDNVEVEWLKQPNIEHLDEPLWKKHWDILFFIGHGESQDQWKTGTIRINKNDKISIAELKNHLSKAIEHGLKLAIFNCCDGLGLAYSLAEGEKLYLPQIIVMREELPVAIAPIFLEYFLEEFTKGISLYAAVRETRKRLLILEKTFPYASGLPVICQNPAHLPPTWNELLGIETGINWREVCQNALVERQRLTTNPLTTGDGAEYSLDEIYVPLGLVEKVKNEKRPGEISPELGSQFYQPEKEYEEVTRTYKNDEFFAQVLKQGQSPKSQGRRLAVTGEPGAGKTTLLQKISQWVGKETERDVAIWVSLADLQGRTIEEYLLQKWLKDILGLVRVTPEMEDALALLFNSGRVWLLLDGVDEIGSNNALATVAVHIRGWIAKARVVVTCRQNVWDAGKNALEGFDVYRNLDFDYPEGVGQFIHGWFAHYPELGKRLLSELAQDGKERIRDMTRNPLRLALLCRAWQIRQGELPDTKAGLYQQFVETMYQWKQEAFPTTSQQQKDLNSALSRLALRGMEQSESRFRLREGLVTEVLGETDEPLCQLALQLGWLNLVGVAVENPDEQVYAFYHPTFQEYFTALAVDDWGYFLHHVPDNPSLGTYKIFEKQWKEVILLWFGRGDLQKEKKEAFIETLIEFEDKVNSFYKYRAYFLAGAAIVEFDDYSKSDEIISQLVSWSIGRYEYNDSKNRFERFFDWRIAQTILSETNKERAVSHLLDLLRESSPDYFVFSHICESLEKIEINNENLIHKLINICLYFLENERMNEIDSLYRLIPIGNDMAIKSFIKYFKNNKNNEPIRKKIGEILKFIDPIGNSSYQILRELDDFYWYDSSEPFIIKQRILEIRNFYQKFKQISDNFSITSHISRDRKLKKLVKKIVKQDKQDSVNKNILNKIKINFFNDQILSDLIIKLIQNNRSEEIREIASDFLRYYIPGNLSYNAVKFLKDSLSDEVIENDYALYKFAYPILWQCAQNMAYPDFYEAWYSCPTYPKEPDNLAVSNTVLTQSLETEINNILIQLKSTNQSYTLPLDIQSLIGETDTSAICQELCTLICSLALPDTNIPTVSNFAQLKQQILTVKKQLQKRHIALIFYNCKPHPPLLTCCRKISDANLGLHILWITDKPLEAPLKGFPPSQDNLLGAMQSWLEEMI